MKDNDTALQILLVEDNPGEIRLTREALREGRISSAITVARDGEEALAILYRQPPHQAAARPDLILLDLNLPRLDGQAVLARIKRDPDLRHIPTVVLSSSQAEEDILQTYGRHANCYISKPMELDRFMAVIRSIEDFWLTVATLPPH